MTLIEQTNEVKCGTEGAEWQKLWNYLQSNHLDSRENYEYVCSLVDIENVADYYIIQMWCSNHDLDNVREFKISGGKWRYILYDLDLTLTSDAQGSAEYLLGKFNSGLYTLNALIYRLLENEEFSAFFAKRLETMLAGTLSEENASAVLEAMYDRLKSDMVYNCERWAGTDSSGKLRYKTYTGWEKAVKSLTGLIKGRNEVLAEEYDNLIEGRSG